MATEEELVEVLAVATEEELVELLGAVGAAARGRSKEEKPFLMVRCTVCVCPNDPNFISDLREGAQREMALGV